MLRNLILKCSTDADLDVSLLARLTPGYDSTTLERLAIQLCGLAAAEGRAPTMSDAARVLEDFAGQEGLGPRLLEPEERRRAAHLAAGQVMIALKWGLIDADASVSILDEDVLRTLTEPQTYVPSDESAFRDHHIAVLDTLLAGPIAHELLAEVQEPSIDDVMLRAIVLATGVASWDGLGSTVPPTTNNVSATLDPHGIPSHDGISSPRTPDHDVRTLLDQRREMVREWLIEALPQLRQLALVFVEDEMVDAPTLAALLHPVRR